MDLRPHLALLRCAERDVTVAEASLAQDALHSPRIAVVHDREQQLDHVRLEAIGCHVSSTTFGAVRPASATCDARARAPDRTTTSLGTRDSRATCACSPPVVRR